MPAVFAKPSASKSWHISWQKIAQFGFKINFQYVKGYRYDLRLSRKYDMVFLQSDFAEKGQADPDLPKAFVMILGKPDFVKNLGMN
jgi:hypothetical protein